MPEIIPQRKFSDLDDFIRGSNNFHCIFLDSHYGDIKREIPAYQRFRKANPELEAELRQSVTMRRRASDYPRGSALPWDRIFEAYKIMSELVFDSDPDIKGNDEDISYLTR